MHVALSHALLALTLASSAAAEERADETVDPSAETRRMRPGNVDLRLAGGTSVLLTSVNAGAGVDLGVVSIGPGTVGIGASLEGGLCVSACWALGALLKLRMEQRFLSTMGRISYHFDLPAKPRQMETVDVYAFAMAGLVLTETRLRSLEPGALFEGEDKAFGAGLGAGMNYFVNRWFFFGGEGRVRYAMGRYETTRTEGDQRLLSDRARGWSLTGVNVQLFIGGRL